MSFDSAFEADVDSSFSFVPACGAVCYHCFDIVVLADWNQRLIVLASVDEDFLGPDS